jgi:hypothetical protein
MRGLKQVRFASNGTYKNGVRGSLIGPAGRAAKPRPALGSITVSLDSTVDPHVVNATFVDERGRGRNRALLAGFYCMEGDKLTFELRPRSGQPNVVGPIPTSPVWRLELERDEP